MRFPWRRFGLCFFLGAAALSPSTIAAPTVVSLAGSGPTGWDNGLFRGEGSPAATAYLNAPTGLARTVDDRILVADYWNDRLRAIDPSGTISSVGGDGWPGNLGDGKALTSPIWGPWGVAMRGSTLVFTDTFNSSVRAVKPDGTLERVAGVMSGTPGSQGDPFGGWSGFSGDNGPATSARLDWPLGICTDAAGNVYVADSWNQRIRKISTNGTISTVAGDGWADAWGRGRFSGDGGPAVQASLNWPTAVAVDEAGNLYIADTYNHRIRRVDATTKTITTVAGNGLVGFAGDGGPATEARLNHPSGLALASGGRIYIADTMNHRIRELTAGSIATIAGDGARGLSGDNGSALVARFNEPRGMVVTSNGDLVVADTGNNRVRMLLFGQTISLSGTVKDAQTLAPLPGATVSWHGIQVTAGADGAYLVPVYPGTQTVIARYPTYGPVSDTVNITEGTTHDFLLPSGFVSARVIDDGGHAIPGATVTTAENQGVTEPDGRVVLRLPPGTHALSASRDGFASFGSTEMTVTHGITTGALITLYRTRSVILPLTYDFDWISTDANPGDYTNNTNDFAFPADELPASGSVVTLPAASGPLSFQFPSTADGAKNAMRANAQTLAVPAGRYVGVHFLEASRFGAFNGAITLRYSDGSTTTLNTTFSDWAWNAIGQSLGAHETVAFPCSHRHNATNAQASPPVDIIHMALPVDPSRNLTGITLPADASAGSQDPYLFAVTLAAIGGPAVGDVNADGSVSLADANLALRAASGLALLPGDASFRADVWPEHGDGAFGDGLVEVGDVSRILILAAAD